MYLKQISTILIIVSFFACAKRAVFTGEVFKMQGELGNVYHNDSLDFSMSYHGLEKTFKNPTQKQVELSMQNGMIYKLKDKSLKFSGDILLLENKFSEAKNDNTLFQTYKIPKKFDLEPFSKNYSSVLKLAGKFDLQDSVFVNSNSVNFHFFEYGTKNADKHIFTYEYLTVIDSFLLRTVFVSDHFNSVNRSSTDVNSREEIQTFKTHTYKLYKMFAKMGNGFAPDIFYKSKGNYLETMYWMDKYRKEPETSDQYNTDATYASFIGDYKKALKYATKAYPTNNIEPPLISSIEDYIPVDAMKILDLIDDTTRVVMLNESHLYPRNRMFLNQLLEPLYKKGFNILACETLIPKYIFGDKRGFTFENGAEQEVIHHIGFYSSEPCYGNLLRNAINLGYGVFAYESNGTNDKSTKLSEAEFREEQEAQNLAEIVKKYPKNKIIVFAGHGHISKKYVGTMKMMAERFKIKTGIIPFCIDQSKMLEADSTANENPNYTFLEKKFKFDKPVCFQKDNKNLVLTHSHMGAIDVQIFNPRTQYDANGYATWLLHQGDIEVPFSLTDKKYKDCIFQIYAVHGNEPVNIVLTEVPVINLPLNGNNTFSVFLKHGTYDVYVFDRHRNIMYRKEIGL